MRYQPLWIALLAATYLATPVYAGVSADQAAKLKGELTPLGAEKAGNKDGTIPAWTGGYTTPVPEASAGKRGDPFKDEKPLFSITQKNFQQHADKLTDGVKAMLAKYPDSFRVDVYPTHRTASAPQWIYDNTFKNATRAKAVGDKIEGAYGGVPFPIPTAGAEVMWNHILRWRGGSIKYQSTNYLLAASGSPVLTTALRATMQLPYYMPNGSPEQLAKTNEFWFFREDTYGPPLRAGESILGRFQFDSNNDQAWVYLTGQRRVRKLPNPCCDTPNPAMAGAMTFDETEVFTGRLDRFDWKIVGKQEKYIPYNNNKVLSAPSDAALLSAHHLNPDYVRWELHRVWVVEGTLRAGARHVVARSRYYCDEDTWLCSLGDRWDANGQLWRTVWEQNFVAPDVPGTIPAAFGVHDLLSGVGFVSNIFSTAPQYSVVKPIPEGFFTPEAMAAEGVR